MSPDGSRVEVGPFQAEFVRVTHSIPDAVAVVLHTAHGAIVHTGDFKIDMTPMDGRPVDIERLRTLGDAGVALLMSDSTNAENPGTHAVRGDGRAVAARDHLRRRPGRVIVTSFASQIHRLQQVIDAADYAKPQGLRDRPLDGAQPEHLAQPRLRATSTRTADQAQGARRARCRTRWSIALHRQPGRAPLGADADGAWASTRRCRSTPTDTVMMSSKAVPGNEVNVGETVNRLNADGRDAC